MNTTRGETSCKGKTKEGKPCRAAAMEGGLCFFHANPNKAVELGRLGGRQNRHQFAGLPDPVKDVKTTKGLLEECARLIEDVRSGKIPPKVATCLAPLLSLQLRVIHGADVDARIVKLEQALASSGQCSNDSMGTNQNGTHDDRQGAKAGSS